MKSNHTKKIKRWFVRSQCVVYHFYLPTPLIDKKEEKALQKEYQPAVAASSCTQKKAELHLLTHIHTICEQKKGKHKNYITTHTWFAFHVYLSYAYLFLFFSSLLCRCFSVFRALHEQHYKIFYVRLIAYRPSNSQNVWYTFEMVRGVSQRCRKNKRHRR